MTAMIILRTGEPCIVDDEDARWAASHSWTRCKGPRGQVYAKRCVADKSGWRRKSVMMHRELLGVTDAALHVDHVNGNSLDNRKSNLRVCTSSVNCHNHHGAPRNGKFGVCFHRRDKRWRARISVGGKSIELGAFLHKAEAVAARAEAERTMVPEIYGEEVW